VCRRRRQGLVRPIGISSVANTSLNSSIRSSSCLASSSVRNSSCCWTSGSGGLFSGCEVTTESSHAQGLSGLAASKVIGSVKKDTGDGSSSSDDPGSDSYSVLELSASVESVDSSLELSVSSDVSEDELGYWCGIVVSYRLD
jgi:hypothetical protein